MTATTGQSPGSCRGCIWLAKQHKRQGSARYMLHCLQNANPNLPVACAKGLWEKMNDTAWDRYPSTAHARCALHTPATTVRMLNRAMWVEVYSELMPSVESAAEALLQHSDPRPAMAREYFGAEP